VVSTHPKNISQIGSFPQVELKIKNVRNHHLEVQFAAKNSFVFSAHGYAEDTQGRATNNTSRTPRRMAREAIGLDAALFRQAQRMETQ